MSLSVGIIGLPNAGKSTLFNALLKKRLAPVAAHPFTTVDPNMGVVSVPDPNLEKLAKVAESDMPAGTSVEIRPAVIKFIDIAGLVKGAHQGQGLGNQFLGHIRDTDVILHVLREFNDPNVSHDGPIDPMADLEIVNMELVLKDLETTERVLSESKKQRAKSKDTDQKLKMLEKFQKALNEGKSLRRLNLSSEEVGYANSLRLLTIKPVLYILNVDEVDLGGKSDHTEEFMNLILRLSDRKPIVVCAKLEQDLPELSKYDREKYLKEMGVADFTAQIDIVDELIQACYDLLGLIVFYTIKGGKIISAWSIESGSTALAAAGKVHSDLAKKFIKAEVISVGGLVELGSWKKAKELGRVKLGGREHVVADGDVIEVKI